MWKPRLGEVCVLFWAKVWLAQARGSRLSEMMCWCCCFKLALARWASLSEAEGLAWARVPSLSEFMRNSILMYACVWWFGCFIVIIGCICMWCGVWAWRTKSNRGLGCAWWLDTWWAWNLLSSRRLLMGEESLVWWLHVSGARWARNCDVPIGYYWAKSP